MPVSAFISYSHADDGKRDRLHKHLAMLRRDNLLSEWSDHEVLAGDSLSEQISATLDNAGLFIALLSPDYLDSNYCYEREFKQATQLMNAGRLRIVGVVVEPCDWKNSPFSRLKVLPKDGKAVSEWKNENIAYVNIVDELRRLLTERGSRSSPIISTASEFTPNKRPTYKIKRDFDSIQKSEFAEKSFQSIASYFEQACTEIHEANEHLRARFESIDRRSFTCTVVNRAKIRGGEAHITITLNRSHRGMGDLSWVWRAHATDGSSNGHLTVEVDDYELFLSGSTDDHYFGERDRHNTAPQAAEQLWNSLMKQAGIEIAD